MSVFMRRLSPFLLLFVSSAADAARPLDDARAIMRTMLATQWRIHANAEVGPVPCVRRRVADQTFGGPRLMPKELEPPLPSAPPPASAKSSPVTIIDISEISFSQALGWHRPVIDTDGYVGQGDEIPEDEVRPLEEAARILRTGPRPRHLIREIDPRWLRKPLEFCAGNRNRPWLEIASPAIHGDIAFIAVDFQCVLCGQGVLYTLRRGQAGWRIVSLDVQWVS